MEVATLYGPRLSPREQQILAQIESTLSKDVSTWNRSCTPLHMCGWAEWAEGIRRRRTALLAVPVVTRGFCWSQPPLRRRRGIPPRGGVMVAARTATWDERGRLGGPR